jgi:hypothetical protein
MFAGVKFDLAVVVEARREPTFPARLPVVPHNLLIPAQPQFAICAALSGVYAARAGGGGIGDFGTARPPRGNFRLARHSGLVIP